MARATRTQNDLRMSILQDPNVITFAEAARSIGKGRSTISRWYEDGLKVPGRKRPIRLVGTRVAGNLYTTPKHLQDFLDAVERLIEVWKVTA